MVTAPTDTSRLTTDALPRLASFDTTTRRSKLPLVDFVQARLDEPGAGLCIGSDAAGTKFDCRAVIGRRPAGGLALSGYADNVPVEAQAWLPRRLADQLLT